MKCFITKCDSASTGWNYITKKHQKCEKKPKSPATGVRGEKMSTAQLRSIMPMRYRKMSMFRPPSEKMLKVWQRVIPDQNKELKMNHVLCELHFKNEDIERDRVVYKKGGIVEREVRKKPILNEEAVPCYFSKNLTPRLRPRLDEGCAVQFELPDNFSEELEKACDKLTVKKLIKETDVNPFFEELTKHVTKYCIPKMLADDASCSFSHITEDCSVWCWWNVHTTCLLKKLLIFKTGKVQIFLQEKEIHIPGCKTVNSLEDCLKLVDKVSNVEACVKLDFITGSRSCPGYVENDDWNSENPEPKRRRCSFCIKYCDANRKRELRMEKEKLLLKKNKNLQARCENLYRQRSRLINSKEKIRAKIRKLHEDCAKRSERAVYEALQKLPLPQQLSVKACLDASKKLPS